MPQKLPSVSIVIPAYNESLNITQCLESCINQTVKPFEIIVVDNLSTDDTSDIVSRLQQRYAGQVRIRLLHQSAKQGITPTRNYGFDRANGDVIGRIDADSTLSPNWVEVVRETFVDPDVAAATGPVEYHDMPVRQILFRADTHIRSGIDKAFSSYRYLFGSNMAIRRSAWHRVAPDTCADEQDLMHEDIDLALHVTQCGLKIVYAPRMIGGISARRLENSPKAFYNYIMRYERTYKHHNFKHPAARIPIFIYLTLYFPGKLVRLAYDHEGNRLSLGKLRERLRKSGKVDELA